MPIEPSFSPAVFGQTCPIETAVDVPVGGSRDTALTSSGGNRLETACPALQHAKLTNARLDPSPRRTCGVGRFCASRCWQALPAWAMPTPPFWQAQLDWYHWFMATKRGADAIAKDRSGFAYLHWVNWWPDGWFDEATFEAVADVPSPYRKRQFRSITSSAE